MSHPMPNERLLRFLQATPEQLAAIDRILEGILPPPMPVAGEAFITKKEAARRLKRDIRTLTTWMQKDWVPFHKIGKTVLFKWSEVDAQLAATRRVGRTRPREGRT